MIFLIIIIFFALNEKFSLIKHLNNNNKVFENLSIVLSFFLIFEKMQEIIKIN